MQFNGVYPTVKISVLNTDSLKKKSKGKIFALMRFLLGRF